MKLRTQFGVANVCLLLLGCGADNAGDSGDPHQGGMSGSTSKRVGGRSGATGEAGGMGGGEPVGGAGGASGGSGEIPTGGMAEGSSMGGTGGVQQTGTGGVSNPCPSHALCDSFESYTTGSNPKSSSTDALWRVSELSSPDLLAVDSAKAYSGGKSLHVKIPVTGDTSVKAMLTTLHRDLLPTSKLYGRMMYFLDAQPVGPSPFHWSFMTADGIFPAGDASGRTNAAFAVGGWYKSTVGGIQSTMTAQGKSGSLDCWNHSRMPVRTGAWVCVEWTLDATANQQTVKMDGTVMSELTFQGTPKGQISFGCTDGNAATQWFIPPISRFSVGYLHWHSSTMARNIWIDDVAISKTGPVGCPAPK